MMTSTTSLEQKHKQNLKLVHDEIYKHGYPQLQGTGTSRIMTLSPDENDDDDDLRDYYEFKWVTQFLCNITYYCCFDSDNHLPEKYCTADSGSYYEDKFSGCSKNLLFSQF
tara:strand:- start:163 stop:495 length:333 start_codon:yes stop_codon:yes gene_type:complete